MLNPKVIPETERILYIIISVLLTYVGLYKTHTKYNEERHGQDAI
jgi:hypothetical protein